MFLSWGKPTIYVKDLETSGAKWVKVATPVEGTTELSTQEGDKTEATVEGGEVEDTKYNANKYDLSFQIRVAKNRTAPITGKNGVVTNKYAVVIVPEDTTTPGFIIQNSAVRVVDSWTAADGGHWQYGFSANKYIDASSVEHELVEWGYFTVSGSGSSLALSATKMDGSTSLDINPGTA